MSRGVELKTSRTKALPILREGQASPHRSCLMMGKSFHSNTNYKITKLWPSGSDLKVSTLTQHLAFGFTNFLIFLVLPTVLTYVIKSMKVAIGSKA